jgi:hypothetical protein
MTRRSRRRKTSQGGGWLGKLAVAGLVLAAILFGGVYLTLRSYLHSDGFRKFLSNEVSRAADVKGDFSRFRWDGLALDTDSFEASGEGPLVSLRADRLHTEAGFGGVKRGVWELNGTSVGRLEVVVDAGRKIAGKEVRERKTPETRKERPKPWYPNEVELKGFEIREANVSALLEDGRNLSVNGLSVKATPEGAKNSFGLLLENGKLEMPGSLVGVIGLDRIKGRFHDGSLFVTSAKASVFGDGRIDAAGEWDTKRKVHVFEGTAEAIPFKQVVNENWAKRVTGTLSSTFLVEGRDGRSEARGSLAIDRATLTALPILDALSAYADTRRFRVIELNEANADWKWTRDGMEFSNVVLSSEGLIRIEGNLAIHGDQLDGTFRLGVARGVLATIPGAEADVFLPGEKGLLWTQVKISGTTDDPKEDLTDRLIAAAGMRMFERLPGGEQVFKFSQTILGGDTPEETIRRGLDAIEKGEDVIRETKGLLEGIFGGDSGSKRKER